MRPPCRPSDTGNGGFVLVNALVIVAALAMLATLLLVRAEGGRARLQAGLEADQLTLALDAFEADTEIGCMLLTGSEKAFAAGANRDIIRECEVGGVPLAEFCDLSLLAMQGIDSELGL